MANNDFHSHQIRLMKVALAVAIIREKPADVSAKVYTERLALKFSHYQTHWKAKADQLEEELLRTRQELVCVQIKLDQKQEEDGCTGSSGIMMDCGDCSSGYNSTYPTPFKSYPHQTTPISSFDGSHNISSCTENSTLEERVAVHLKFMHNVAVLQSCNIALSTTSVCDLQSTLRDSIVKALNGLAHAISSPSPLPIGSNTCTEVVERLVGMLQSGAVEAHKEDVYSASKTLLRAVVSRLVRKCYQYQTSQVNGTMMVLLCKLAELQELHPLAIELLVCFIEESVVNLGHCAKEPVLLDPGMTSSLGAAVASLECVLTGSHHTVPHSVLSMVSGLVEGPLLDISSTFPLVSWSVWRIHALMIALNGQSL